MFWKKTNCYLFGFDIYQFKKLASINLIINENNRAYRSQYLRNFGGGPTLAYISNRRFGVLSEKFLQSRTNISKHRTHRLVWRGLDIKRRNRLENLVTSVINKKYDVKPKYWTMGSICIANDLPKFRGLARATQDRDDKSFKSNRWWRVCWVFVDLSWPVDGNMIEIAHYFSVKCSDILKSLFPWRNQCL